MAVLGLGCAPDASLQPGPGDADPCGRTPPCDGDAAGPPDADGATAVADADLLEGDGGAQVADAGPDAPPACPASTTAGHPYSLCVWLDADELQALHEDIDTRREIPAIVTLDGETYDGVELELHGGTARTFEKKSYRVRFPEQRPRFDFFADGSDERVERLVLQASWIDPTFVRAKLAFDSLRELGALAPRTSHARLYINGEFAGLYIVIERVDEHFLSRHGLSREGNLYKAESIRATFEVHADPLRGFSERTHEDGSADDLADLFRAVADTELSYEAFQREIASRLSLSDFDLWQQVMGHALNLDSFWKNYYLYRDPRALEPARAQVFRVIHWDADATFGLWWDGSRYERPDEVWLYNELNVLAPRLYAIPEYRTPYLRRYQELLDEELSTATLQRRAEALLYPLADDIRADAARWERTTSFDDERAYLLQTIALRGEVMSAALDEALGEPDDGEPADDAPADDDDLIDGGERDDD